MSAPAIHSAIVSKLTSALGAGVPVSPELRRFGDPTPAVVYDVQSGSFDMMLGGATVYLGTFEVRFDCVADRALAAFGLMWDVREALTPRWTNGSGSLRFTATAASFSTAVAVPDDGQGDAERTASLSITFHVEEIT